LGARNLPVILCEGTYDIAFLETIAKFCNRDFTSEVQLISIDGGGPVVSRIVHIAKILRHQHKNLRIMAILDRDFAGKESISTKQKALKDVNVELICWDLPAIENYLFIHLAKLGKFDVQNCFEGEAANALFDSYWHSVVSENKDNLYEYFKIWEEARSLAKSSSGTELSIEDLTKISNVIHGHTWVKYCGFSKTIMVIQEMNENILKHCPILAKIVMECVRILKLQSLTEQI
jgi:hypothetical protein